MRLAGLSPAELRAAFGAAGAGEPHPAAEAVGGPGERLQALVADLARLVAGLVQARPEEIGARTPLGEVGMNSVTFTALSAELRKAYGIEVYPTLFYRRGTLLALAEHLWEHHRAELAARFGSAPAPGGATVAAPSPSANPRSRAAPRTSR